ncbi:MAG: maleylpyruvate isomerase N-terminal domain-containing protein, partial [Chloroflexota bacterium]
TFEQNFAIYMENVTPMSVQELATQIGAKRAKWDDALRQMPSGRMDEPLLGGWTVREAIAILTWKERRVAEMMRRRAFVEARFGQLPQAEQARILEASHAQSLPALLEQHHEAHREMLDALRALSDDDLNAECVEGLAPEERFWKAIAWTTWWSYPDFTEALRQLLAEDAPGSANSYSSS